MPTAATGSIDDDAVFRAMLSKLLAQEGYQVAACGNAKQGLATAISEAHDLVLLDIMMPDVDGLELLKNLRTKSNVRLILGSDVASDLIDTSRFPVSQDQRNAIRAKARFEPNRKLWFAVSGEYGSGLPADIGDEDPDFLLAQFGPAILSRVNLALDRVRPSSSIDVGGGAGIYRREQCSVEFKSNRQTSRIALT